MYGLYGRGPVVRTTRATDVVEEWLRGIASDGPDARVLLTYVPGEDVSLSELRELARRHGISAAGSAVVHVSSPTTIDQRSLVEFGSPLPAVRPGDAELGIGSVDLRGRDGFGDADSVELRLFEAPVWRIDGASVLDLDELRTLLREARERSPHAELRVVHRAPLRGHWRAVEAVNAALQAGFERVRVEVASGTPDTARSR